MTDTMSCCDGFRLPAPSECSLRSKARIDALFEDSRSVCSSSFTGPWTSVQNVEGCCAGDEDQRRVNSAVQARIEAMFASVEAESATPGECAAAVLPVKYMGAAPVGGRVASVRGLQEPLRQLVERIAKSVNAELEVSRRGLTFRTSELHEKNNPFRRIAVWSALKLQTRRRHNNSQNSQDMLHAFVPLVADDRPSGPSSSLSNSNVDDRHADLYRTMRGLAKDVENYPPIFAVVMRRPGAARLLECHAFACRCEEDAIAAAATLYRALLADLDATARRPRQKNGLGCVSLASVASSVREPSPSSKRASLDILASRTDVLSERSASKPAPPGLPPPPPPPPPPPGPPVNQPTRPPRIKKHSISSSANSVTESDHSSSSPCTNVSIVDKSQRRGKKNSDVKAEDVLEARSRRLYSPLRDPNAKESNAAARRNGSNSSSGSSANFEQTKEERCMNAKNKTYGSRSSQNSVSSEGVQVIEKIYDRENEPRTSDRQRSSSYDYSCCTENSLYESTRMCSKTRLPSPASKTKSDRMYDVTRPSGRSTPSSRKSTTGSSFGRPQPPMPNRTEEQQRRRSSSAARHQDHFRDVDKIYSLESDDLYTASSRDQRIYDVTRPSRQSSSVRGDSSSVRSSNRLNRISTMDRPLRRPSVEPPQPPSLTRLPSHRSQLQTGSRQRRRSRAGSEPPISRTDAAAVAAASAAALLKRSQSDLDLDRGDLMTRVELPRRGSFLKPGSVRRSDDVDGGGCGGGGGGTPLGFTELFDEFRNQEGLTSVDDILAAIIDPEGMSFNDLKPLYKEFLLKLAATLTQDELYQRSASIMRRRRGRPQRRRSSRSNAGSSRPSLLRRAIKRSVSRLRSSASAPTEFTSVIFPARRLNERSSCGSSSSCDVVKAGHTSSGYCHGPKSSRVLASKLGRRRSTTRCSSSKSRIGHTTSEDSDTCRRFGRGMIAANRSSSGYVSCSECSYDSESCTCVSADKCYCSLSRKTPQGSSSTIGAQAQPLALPCSCDTDSCSESNKCYCARKPALMMAASLHSAHSTQPSILEQLRQKGIVPSESTLSRGDTPDGSKSRRASRSLATSKSLEYLKVRSSSVRGSMDNLALDYDLFSPGYRHNQPHSSNSHRSSQCSSGSEKVLVVSARDPQGRLIYVGGSGREGKRSSRHCRGGRHDRQPTGHHEALSIKKSAEIAAVFGGQARIGRRTSSTSSLRSSISLEAGLGYLP